MSDLLAAETATDVTPTLREGHDFHDQQQLQQLQPRAALTPNDPASPVSSAVSLAAELAAAVLEELRIFEYTGWGPGGVSWAEQPAWRVELWQTYWQAHQAASDWFDLDYPLRDY